MKKMQHILTALLLVASARSCGPSNGETERTWAEMQATYGEIDSLHAQMMDRYGRMQTDAPAEMQELYGSMQQMHRSASHMHDGMMSAGGAMMGGRMMGGRMDSGAMRTMYQTREWDRQMHAMHQQMSAYMREMGHGDMAAMHDQMAAHFGRAAEAIPEMEGEGSPESGGTVAAGDVLYRNNCATCHGADGEGRAGVFPPLAGSGWVTGDVDVLLRILLHGMQGEVEVRGASYDGTMPAFGARLSDPEVAAIASHIRSSWMNAASSVEPEEVREIRTTDGRRSGPWQAEELR